MKVDLVRLFKLGTTADILFLCKVICHFSCTKSFFVVDLKPLNKMADSRMDILWTRDQGVQLKPLDLRKCLDDTPEFRSEVQQHEVSPLGSVVYYIPAR